MNESGMSRKRAARIERRKAKLAAFFNWNKIPEDEKQETEESASETAAKKPRLSDEDYKMLRQKLREKSKLLTNRPQFRLARVGLTASLAQDKESRVPVFIADVQSLLINSIAGDKVANHPHELFKIENWNNLSSITVLVVENVGVDDFESNPEKFQKMDGIFNDKLEICNPIIENLTVSLALAYIPLTVGGLCRVAQTSNSLDNALKNGFIHNIEDILPESQKKNKVKAETSHEIEETVTPCSKLDLLLSPAQLVVEQYPLPGLPEFAEFLVSKKEYHPVSNQSPLFSIDCEWVTCEGGDFGLARIAVINEALECVYHSLVKPPLRIVDYQTRFSGITPKMLVNVKTTLEDVQRKLHELLPPDAIIVGQSVGNDLSILKMLHPYIIDTSVIFNLTGNRNMKSKLSMLTRIFLKRDIQNSKSGHNPVEDAVAAMELVLLKLKMGKEYGDVTLDRKNSRWLASSHRFGPATFATLNRIFRDPNHVITYKDERTYHPDCCLHQKFFTFVQWHNVSSLLITHLDYLDHYNPLIRKLDPRWLSHMQIRPDVPVEPVGPVKVVQTHGARDAVQKAIEGSNQKKLNFIHTRLEAFSPVDRNNEIKALDDSITQLFDTVPVNGLLVVIFSGTRKPLQNGLCLIRIREPQLDPQI